jgi:hypothetical protein
MKMKPEEAKAVVEQLVAASGTSVLRAAAAAIMESLNKHEEIEGEEQKVADAIKESSIVTGAAPSLIAAMMIHGVAQSYYQEKMKQAHQFKGVDVSQMQKVGNC